MQHVRHELLKAHVLHPCDAFGALKVGFGTVPAFLPLASIVNEEFRDFAQSTAFFAEIRDYACTALLRGFHADLDAMNEVGAAGADVGAEHIRAVALVVDAAGQFAFRVRDRREVADDIDRDAADGRKENMVVGASHQFRKHASGLLKEAAAQLRLANVKTLRHARKVPDRFDRDFRHADLPGLQQDFAVRNHAAFLHRHLEFRKVQPRPRHCNRRADVETGFQFIRKHLSNEMPERIERNNLVRIMPLRMRPQGNTRGGVREVRNMIRIQLSGRHRKGTVDGVRAGVRADDVALGRVLHRADHWPSHFGVGLPPLDFRAALFLASRMRGQDDMFGFIHALFVGACSTTGGSNKLLT